MEPHTALILKNILPPPCNARHWEYSMLFSADDNPGKPSARLIALAAEVIQQAVVISLEEISARLAIGPFYPEIWPGEHYRLLAALVKVLAPRLVLEIGTGSGLSALSILKFLPAEGKLITFDTTKWQDFDQSVLRFSDFADSRLLQHTVDLSDAAQAAPFSDLFKEADFIFVDAEKDGVMEGRFLNVFQTIGLKPGAILMFDDIHLWKMLSLWREITLPKLDMSSFGHWSGTGWVEWV